jgi:hypothetical protein
MLVFLRMTIKSDILVKLVYAGTGWMVGMVMEKFVLSGEIKDYLV